MEAQQQIKMEDLAAFGKVRMHSAQDALAAFLTRAGAEAYTGTFQSPGETKLEIVNGVAERDFAGDLMGFITGQGVTVWRAYAGAERRAANAETAVGPERRAAPAAHAPFETILILAKLPMHTMGKPGATVNAMFEACAEVMRVLLANAIRDAKADAMRDEKVIVRFRVAPEFSSKLNFETGNNLGLGRMRAAVVCETEPRASYLLGSIHGMPKPFNIAYELPLVEMYYGEDRIRWKDRRAPDCDALIQVVGVAQ